VAKSEKGIWQRRYWEHHIRDEADYSAHVRYCWINPVKHGFVKMPTDWPHSSIHREIRSGRVEPEWPGEIFDGAFGE
jgi:putative transposase